MKITKSELQKIVQPIVEETVKKVLTKILVESFAETMIKETLGQEHKRTPRRRRKRNVSPNRDNILREARQAKENNLESLRLGHEDEWNVEEPSINKLEQDNPVSNMLNEMGIDASPLQDDMQNPPTPPVKLNELSSLGIDMDFSSRVDKMNNKSNKQKVNT